MFEVELFKENLSAAVIIRFYHLLVDHVRQPYSIFIVSGNIKDIKNNA